MMHGITNLKDDDDVYTGDVLDSTRTCKLTVTLFWCSSHILGITCSYAPEWRLIPTWGIYGYTAIVPTWRLHSCVETFLAKENRASFASCMYISFGNAKQNNGPHLNLEPFTEPMTDINKRRPRCAYSSNTYCTCPSQAFLECVPRSRASLSCCGPTAMETTPGYSVTTLAWRGRGGIFLVLGNGRVSG